MPFITANRQSKISIYLWTARQIYYTTSPAKHRP